MPSAGLERVGFRFDSLGAVPKTEASAALPAQVDVAVAGGAFTGLWSAHAATKGQSPTEQRADRHFRGQTNAFRMLLSFGSTTRTIIHATGRQGNRIDGRAP